ncbi:tetratricopeptide repeat protein [Bacteroidota bacterium]
MHFQNNSNTNLRESTKNTFNKKIKLICEYNRTSPLFVRLANSEMQDKNIETAITLLLAGLDVYPDNPVAHLLLGKAFALMGNYDKALDCFKKGSDIIQSGKTYDHYVNELQTFRKQRSLFEVTRGNSFFNETKFTSNLKNEPDLFHSSDKNIEDKKLATSIDDRLNQLADQISKAKISTSYSHSVTNSDFESIFKEDNLIISETLAKIYVAQDEYEEAIKVLEKLIAKEPERADYYTNMINEIKQKVNS